MDHYLKHSDGDDLDKLIKKFEFENQNCVRLIQKEGQHIEALEKEIREGKSLITDLQEKISQLDYGTKQGHRQYIYNRDNCESLKKTLVVLKEHDEALDRQLTALEDSSQQERNGRLEILQHYKGVWEDYQGKYKTFPLAQSLEEKRECVSSLEKQLQEMESQIKHLHIQINEINESTDDELKDLNKFVVNLAGVKLVTDSMSCKIRQTMEVRRQIKEQIRQEKISREEREAQMLAVVNAREDINSSEASLVKSSQDHVQPHTSQDSVEPHTNPCLVQPHVSPKAVQDHVSPEPVQDLGSPEHAQPYTSPEPKKPSVSPEDVQSCLSSDRAQPHLNTEHVQPSMDTQESEDIGGSLLINMFSEKQDEVDPEGYMETSVKPSLQPTVCHPLVVLPQHLTSSQPCPQTQPRQAHQRQPQQRQQGQLQPQQVQQQQQQQQQPFQVQRQQQQQPQMQQRTQQVQQWQQQVRQQQVQRQQQQQQMQQQPQQVRHQHQVQQQQQQYQQVQQQQQQYQQVQQQSQEEQSQQVAPPTASNLNHVSVPNFNHMSGPMATSINQMPAPKTSSYNQILVPKAPSIGQIPAPKTPNLNQMSAPRTPNINQLSAPRTPSLNKTSSPRASSVNQMPAPKTPNFISAPRTPSINQLSAPRTPSTHQLSAPRTPSINQMSAPRTLNFSQISAPQTPSINQMSAPRTPNFNQISAPQTPSINQMSAPRTQNFNQISAPRAPSISQMSAPKAQMPSAQRVSTHNQVFLTQKEPTNVSTSSSTSPGVVSSTQPPQTTQQTDTVQHCPKTPPSSGIGYDAMELSPFDFEKHQQQLKLLSKSPGPISYSTRTMFAGNQNDPQDSVGGFLNPFIGEASNLFGEGNTGGFETGQAMSLFGNDKANNLFGNGGTNSAGPGNHSSRGGDSLMSLFGSGDQTSPSLEGQEQETSFSFNFGTDQSGDSLMSLFGGGTDNSIKSTNTKESSFSMNFGGGSNTSDSPRGFSLF